MDNLKSYCLVALLAAGIGGAATKFYWPTPVNTDTESTRNNITTEVKEVTKPDGSKEVTTVTHDKSTKKSTDTKAAVVLKPKWHVSVTATCSAQDLKCQKTLYGAQVEYNFAGPFTAGIRVDTDKQVGVVLGVSF